MYLPVQSVLAYVIIRGEGFVFGQFFMCCRKNFNPVFAIGVSMIREILLCH
uniref:Uncharacterized protein n=1 Tax=Arundo donax TaxID=35708 RepID=A0A0A9BKI3_ARUDO